MIVRNKRVNGGSLILLGAELAVFFISPVNLEYKELGHADH